MKETAYLLQAGLIAAWWIGMAISKSFFAAFQFQCFPPESFWAFFAPDVVLIAGLSIVRAYYDRPQIEWAILGAFAYATLYCCHAAVLTASGYLPAGLMILGLFYNLLLCFEQNLFRTASSGLVGNFIKTLIQIICIWLLTLGVIPYILLDAFGGELDLKPNPHACIAVVIFVLASVLGLRSAYVMVRDGQGTPLPLDQPCRLVVSGPYRYVRNPMAIAGIGQGLAIALAFLSLPILVYALVGALVWHIVIRPIEERDLVRRFGEPYLTYRARVDCWIPRIFRRSDLHDD